MQFTTPGDLEFIWIRRWLDPKRDVMDNFSREAFSDIPAGNKTPVPASKWRSIYLKRHAYSGFIHHKGRKCFNHFGSTDRVRNMELVKAGKGNYLSRYGLAEFHSLKPVKTKNLHNSLGTDVAININQHYGRVLRNTPALNTANTDDSNIARVCKSTNLKLERPYFIYIRWGHMILYRLK